MNTIKTIASTTLSFLRRAHLLHGFLACFALWHLTGALIFFLAIQPDGQEILLSKGLPLGYFLISLPFSLIIGFSWDQVAEQNAKWEKIAEEKRAKLAAAKLKRDALRAALRDNPDFLSVQIFALGEPDMLLLHVKAAPYGHSWPHQWDGMRVVVIVASSDEWEKFKEINAAKD